MNELDKVRNIFLIRHCKPEFKEGIRLCIGKSDIPLSNEGLEHAKQLAYYFTDININCIYSSPLKRAKETAEIIAEVMAGSRLNVVIKENFSELNIGKWDGLSFEEIKLRYPEEYENRGKDLDNYIVEGGESMAMCRERAIRELHKTIEESHGNILVVAHAGVIRTIISSLLNISIKETFDYKIDYGSVSLVTINENIIKLNNIGVANYKER